MTGNRYLSRYGIQTNGAKPAPVAEPPPAPSIWTPDYGEPEPPRIARVVPHFRTITELVNGHSRMREPIIDGLLRRGETANAIGASKIGKSWMATGLGLCVQTGRRWLDRFDCVQGNVLIIDNELHSETSANRIPAVAAAMQIPDREYADGLCIENLRGRLVDIFAMEEYFEAIEPGRFDLIILDAFYRFTPGSASENDNAAMSRIYNAIDRYAHRLGCAFLLIHHASKGSQADKAITDVGSGAGSMSRAADTHFVMRAHEQEGCVVLDAVARSWPPLSPVVLRWEFPVFVPDESLDPEALKRQKPASQQNREQNDREGINRIVEAIRKSGPLSRTKLAAAAGMDPRRLDRLLVEMGESVQRTSTTINGNAAEVIGLAD